MFHRITLFSVLLSCLCFASNAQAGILGPLLDGGGFDGREDFIRTSINGTATLGTPFQLSNGDTIVAVLPFTTVGDSVLASTGPLGQGFGAIVFSATVNSATPTSGTFAATGNLGTLLSNVTGVGGGAFAALLTSRTVNFTTGLPAINSSNVTLEALFDLKPGSGNFVQSFGVDLDLLFTLSLNAVPGSFDAPNLNFVPVGVGPQRSDLIVQNNPNVGNLAVLGANAGTNALGGNLLARMNAIPAPGTALAVLGGLACMAMGRFRSKRNVVA